MIRRYKRFLADVLCRDGRIETVHCANPGAMTGCAAPNSRVLLSKSTNPRRKLRYTWELVRVGRTWVCVNTQVANRVVGHWIETRRITELSNFETLRKEVRHGNSRFDFGLDDDTLIEVKTVTLKTSDGMAAFPDAKTERGRRHLDELAKLKGRRRVLFYFVARGDVTAVRPAREIDPRYADALRRAVDAGVEVIAVRASFSARGVRRGPRLDVVLESA